MRFVLVEASVRPPQIIPLVLDPAAPFVLALTALKSPKSGMALPVEAIVRYSMRLVKSDADGPVCPTANIPLVSLLCAPSQPILPSVRLVPKSVVSPVDAIVTN
jgi:hypothetical protein